MFKKMPKKVLPLTLTLVTLVTFVTLSLFAIKFSSIFYILIGAGVSIIVNSIILASKKANKGGND
jgi:uncharacterized membrane protein YgaE (UPF0421/DUF939 family)